MGTDDGTDLAGVHPAKPRDALAQDRGDTLGSVRGGKMLHRDIDQSPSGALDGYFGQPGNRLAGRANPLESDDPSVDHVEQRLDRKSSAQQGRSGADPPPSTQEFQRVDIEQGDGRGGGVHAGSDDFIQAASGPRPLSRGQDGKAQSHSGRT